MKNKDGMSAADFCTNSKRHDFLQHISQFSEKIGSVLTIDPEVQDIDIQKEIDKDGTWLNSQLIKISELETSNQYQTTECTLYDLKLPIKA